VAVPFVTVSLDTDKVVVANVDAISSKFCSSDSGTAADKSTVNIEKQSFISACC
jgi:hypothetical protein